MSTGLYTSMQLISLSNPLVKGERRQSERQYVTGTLTVSHRCKLLQVRRNIILSCLHVTRNRLVCSIIQVHASHKSKNTSLVLSLQIFLNMT